MCRTSVATSLAAVPFLSSAGAVLGAERYEDAVGDAGGDAPDIMAVTVSEPGGGPTLRFEIELAKDPPLDTDRETWTDAAFVTLSPVATIDERGLLSEDLYTTGTHGMTVEDQRQTGGFLAAGEELYWYVVDAEVDGSVVSFTVDRKLLGDAPQLYWQVLTGLDRADTDEDEIDVYPDTDRPPALYVAGEPGG
jgi:hypothetical protein